MAFQGSLAELPLPDIIQLVSVSGKTGRFDLSHESETGHIYLRDGQIVRRLDSPDADQILDQMPSLEG